MKMLENTPLPEGTTLRQVNAAFEDIAETAYNADVAREADEALLTFEAIGAKDIFDKPLDPLELNAFRELYLRLLEHKNDE